MRVSKLQLIQFKNYTNVQLAFKTRVICFVGNNGEGKTNLLDAIYYTSIGKSYFNSIEKMNILHSKDFFRIDAQVNNQRIEIVYDPKKVKTIKNDGVVYEKLADHLGFSPVTFVAPDDNIIILGGSEFRRREMNATISQMNNNYVQLLIQYRKILRNRTATLKSQYIDRDLLNIYDEQLTPLGNEIYSIREKFMYQFTEIVQSVYAQISEEKETVQCIYKSKLSEEPFEELLLEAREKDVLLRRNSVGIHRDDIQFLINGYPLKKYGSQGQQKTFLLALKLAEYHIIQRELNKEPIILLDDIFDKLDQGRVKELFEYLFHQTKGQIFLSDTNYDRLYNLLNQFDQPFTIFRVENNNVQLV